MKGAEGRPCIFCMMLRSGCSPAHRILMEVALSQTKSTLLVRLRPLMVAAVGYALFVLAVYWPEPRHLSWLWVLVETKWSAPGQTDWTAARIAPLAPQLLYLTCAPLYLFRLKILDYAVTTIARILVIIAFLNLLITPTFTGTFSTEAAAGISWLVNASLFAWMLLFLLHRQRSQGGRQHYGFDATNAAQLANCRYCYLVGCRRNDGRAAGKLDRKWSALFALRPIRRRGRMS